MVRGRLVRIFALFVLVGAGACGASTDLQPSDDSASADGAANTAAALPVILELPEHGLSVRLPEGWEPVDLTVEDLEAALDVLPAGANIDASAMAAVVEAGGLALAVNLDDVGSGFARNLLVLTEPRDGRTHEELLEQLEAIVASQGKLLDSRLEPFGDSQRAVVSYKLIAQYGGTSGVQHAFLSEDDLFILNLATDDLDADAATFEAIGASFEFLDGTAPLVPTPVPTATVPPTPTPRPSATPEPTPTPSAAELADSDGDGVIFEIDVAGPYPSDTFLLPMHARVAYEGPDDRCSVVIEHAGDGVGDIFTDLSDGVRRVDRREELAEVYVEKVIGCDDGGRITFSIEPPSPVTVDDLPDASPYYVHSSLADSENFVLPAGAVASYSGDDLCGFVLNAPIDGEQSDSVGFVRFDEQNPWPLGLTETTVVYISGPIGCGADIVFEDPS
ncbi:MAG: hypothetical protein KDB21_17590 [Acidimicrobiales bacterium]|nr:hypothetical protein [Acidimicrobiales bacterium]